MYKNITKTAAAQLINDYLGSKVEYWERYFRTMYYYNRSATNAAVGTASYQVEGDAGGATDQKLQEKLIGLLPSYMATLEFDEDKIHMTFVHSYTINNVRKLYTSWIQILLDNETTMVITHYNGVNAALFGMNKTLYEQNQTIANARGIYGLPLTSTTDEVIVAMATQTWKLRYDPPQYSAGDVVARLDVARLTDNTAGVELTVEMGGSAMDVVRTHIEVWPTAAVAGLPDTVGNKNCGAQFPWENKFTLTTDLRLRSAYQMLGGGPYRVRAWATVREDDGDDYGVYTEAIVELTDTNPLLEQ